VISNAEPVLRFLTSRNIRSAEVENVFNPKQSRD
jgi:hypothetical protein